MNYEDFILRKMIQPKTHGFDVIERLLWLYTNEGDLVYSPFSGIGSEGYCSVKMRRKFIGTELKKSYFDMACGFLSRAESESLDLFSAKSTAITA